MNQFRWTALAGILVAFGGCREAVAPESSVPIGDAFIQLTVSSSAPEVARGFPVTFRANLENVGSAAATLHFGDSCQIVPYLTDRLGQVVLPAGGSWGCLTVITQLSLQPGESVVREYVWTGSTDFQSEMPLRPLPVGKYFFTVKVPSGEATLSVTTEIILK